MKTPIDATGYPGATKALLEGGAQFEMIDLWTITLNGGAVVRWHGGSLSLPVTFNGNTWLSGPGIDRGKISTKLGPEVATLDATFSAGPSDLINGVPLIPFVQGRGFDGATAVLHKAFLPSWSQPITGCIISFSGRVTAIKDLSRIQFSMTVSSWTVLLNVSMGPDVFQAGCLNSHYDPSCGLTPTNVGGTISAGTWTQTSFNTNLSNADNYFSKGKIVFTSGANAGLSRAVSTYLHTSGAIKIAFPLPYAPAPGDTFNAVRGCMLNIADCTAQGNLLKFRGQTFTPPAITGAVG